MKKAFVLGSINYDVVVYTDKMPILGDSIIGDGMIANLGGKGANHAIAAKKIGIDEVFLISAVGDDVSGDFMLKRLKEHGINTSGVEVIEGEPSGTCFIIFNRAAEDNAVIVGNGANLLNNPQNALDLLQKHAKKGDIFITQLETNLEALYKAVNYAREIGMYIIMNPSPVCDFDKSIMTKVDLLILNKAEAEALTDVKFKSEEDLVTMHKKLGAKETIITLGGDGSYFISGEEVTYQDIIPTKVVDTTCAGDTFLGAMAYRKASGNNIKDSMRFAATASSIAVSRKGATESIPTLIEILDKYN